LHVARQVGVDWEHEQLGDLGAEAACACLQRLLRGLNLLLAAAFARAQRQGTLVDGLQVDGNNFTELGRALAERPAGQRATLEAVAVRNADTPDPIAVELRWVGRSQAGGPKPTPAGP
jgi:hypothetical protein